MLDVVVVVVANVVDVDDERAGQPGSPDMRLVASPDEYQVAGAIRATTATTVRERNDAAPRDQARQACGVHPRNTAAAHLEAGATKH
jgi:hypothetical protein